MKHFSKGWVLVALIALVAAGTLQRRNEHRRIESKLTWSDPDKNALEAGFLALGGFRGLVADALWIRAIRQQDSGQYYDLRLLGDIILKLQPTFSQVHGFLGYNLAYNLANKAESCDERWYWIRSGIATVERGLERNHRSHWLWYELGYYYFDRLSPRRMKDCLPLAMKELPRIENVPEEERRSIFLSNKTYPGLPARPDEYLRWSAYCYWKAIQTGTDPQPFRMERQFATCLELLGHWRSSKPPEECKNWEDWGAEDYWAHLLKQRDKRPDIDIRAIKSALPFLLAQQMDAAEVKGDTERAKATYERLLNYFPGEIKPYDQFLKDHRDYVRKAREQQERTAKPAY